MWSLVKYSLLVVT